MEQRVTVKKQIKHLFPYIIFSFIMFITWLYIKANPIGNNIAEYVVYAAFFIVSIIHIYLHLDYYFNNRKVKVLYDDEKKIIKCKRKGKETIISPSNLEKIEIHQSRFYKKKGGFLTTDNYRFYKFILEGNRHIVITSLLYPNFECSIEGKTEIKERIIASIFNS